MLAGAINAVRAGYLLAKVWELETVSTPGELGGKVEKQQIDIGYDL